MMFLPSDCFCRLKDQEYLELVFEDGQILTKSQRSKEFSLQNPRTITIMDLYEVEYNEDFKKTIHSSGGFIKNLGDTHVVPKHHVVASYGKTILETNNKHVDESTSKASSSKMMVRDYENRKKIDFAPPDEQSVVSERSIELGFDPTDFTEESEWSAYLCSVRGIMIPHTNFVGLVFIC